MRRVLHDDQQMTLYANATGRSGKTLTQQSQDFRVEWSADPEDVVSLSVSSDTRYVTVRPNAPGSVQITARAEGVSESEEGAEGDEGKGAGELLAEVTIEVLERRAAGLRIDASAAEPLPGGRAQQRARGEQPQRVRGGEQRRAGRDVSGEKRDGEQAGQEQETSEQEVETQPGERRSRPLMQKRQTR